MVSRSYSLFLNGNRQTKKERINMTKNMTRKGLALGAVAALAVSGFSLPANAAGLADTSFVSLAPTTGTEYTVLAGASGKTFSLTSNETSTVAGGNFKFLVEGDLAGLVEPTQATTGRAITVANNAVVGLVVATDTLTIADAALAATLAVNDVFFLTEDLVVDAFDDGFGTTPLAKAADNDVALTVSAVASDNSTFSFVSNIDYAAFQEVATTGLDVTGAVDDANGVVGEVVREARDATTGAYVVDTATTSASTDSVLVLGDSSVDTKSVTVTAWVDSNANDAIDSTEYASPVRTVTFVAGDEVTGAVTVEPFIVGSTSVIAHVATTPALNGNQMTAGDVNAMFTYQGSANSVTPAGSAAVFNTTTRVWDVTSTRSVATGTTAVAAGVLTVTHTSFGSNLGLTAGETIVLDVPAAANDGTYVVASVSSATVFTAVTTSTTNTGAEIGTAKVAIVPGSYSVRAKIGTDYISSALPVVVAVSTSDDGSAVVTETANINSTGNETATVVATVRAKTLSASTTLTFVDEDDAAVSAGRAVRITVDADTVTGLKVNGTTANAGTVIDAVTDANGQVLVTVTATAAINGQSVDLTAVAEGVSTTSTGVDFDWADGTIYLYDLNSSASAVRSISEGGSYNFDFTLVDTWAQNVTGDYRLKVATSGNNVSETYPSISTGRATVSVADQQTTTNGDITVVVDAQKKSTAGVWQEDSANSVVPAQQTLTLKTVSQSGGAVTAVSADAIVATYVAAALAAGDTRITQAAVTADGSAGTDAIEITGTVTSATTGVTRPGAAVTISGDSSILFVDGARAAFGSITVIASATGTYSVHARSNTVQKASVVTVSALGGSKTIKVTFEGAKDDSASAVSISAPANVVPGSTLQVTVKLTDKYGNPVVTNGTAADGWINGTDAPGLTVTYTGPGLRIGDLPTATGANGEATFTVLLGSNDSGSIVVTASYDGNTGSTVNTNVYSATSTITVGAAAVAVSATKVNVGSFKGYVALYAKGYKGKKMSAIVAGKWIVVASLATDFERVVRYTGAGYDIVTTIYIDGVSVQSFNVTTK